MIAKVCSAGIAGIDGTRVTVECFLSAGLPAFDIVGLPDTAVKESRERVRAAMKTSGYEFPLRRITVNMAPADLKKEGPVYDLAIFFGILAASGQCPPLPEGAAFFGELSLSGELRPVAGMLPMALAAKADGIGTLFVPAQNAEEAALSGVDQSLHEAAKIDGANKFQRVLHIDLPALAPTICIMLILNCGNLMSIGYEKTYLMQNDLNVKVSEIISTYVYKIGIINREYSYSTAIGLFNSAVNYILVMLINKIMKKLNGHGLW